ncbi:MAG TPA: hypothetical protein VFC06_06930 [Demequina sp.]|nr:hypothetical protein [Demequina sp.]
MRQPDGYFGVPPEWRNRNVSGVLVVNQLMPYYVQRAETTLWRQSAPSISYMTRLDSQGMYLTSARVS